MKRSALAFAAVLACTAVYADYDPKLEAQEAAQRKAAAAAEAKKKAEAKKQMDAAEQKMMRGTLGKEAEGKSDSEVKVLYDRKMGGYRDQAKRVQAGGPAPGGFRLRHGAGQCPDEVDDGQVHAGHPEDDARRAGSLREADGKTVRRREIA